MRKRNFVYSRLWIKYRHKTLCTVFIILLTFLFSNSYAQSQRDYLIKALQDKPVAHYLQNVETWRTSHKRNLLAKIAALPDSVKNRLTKTADRYLDYSWPALTASMYLDYNFTGNRSRFQNVQNDRRKALSYLAIGALITGDKKYIPQIANGLWSMLEESTWVLPAHIVLQKAGSGLPDPDETLIDLGSAITAPMIAYIRFMLADQLQEYSPIINKRVDIELRKRMYIPYLERNDLWWMGFQGQQVNNWNAWCNTNMAHTALLNEKNADTLAMIMEKVMKSTDIFINQYPDDGGCDEGPSYWGEAGGKMIRLLHLLNSISDGKLNWLGNSLMHNMGTYIYKMQIAGEYYVNFADALPEIIPSAESVYRFGEAFDDVQLKQFGGYLFNQTNKKLPGSNIAEFLETLDIYTNLITEEPRSPLPDFTYLPNLEVVTARSEAGSSKGLFMAVQGSNNGVSHNHNDVGNFIIYANGKPVIIDAGVGTYTSQTFSSRRYELWNMQSQWHNLPTINGVMQKDGKKFKATGFSASSNYGVQVKMDIAGAYPSEAEVKKWERTFFFNQKQNTIRLTENYELKRWKEESNVHFLTVCNVAEDKPGMLHFLDRDNKTLLTMKYNPSEWTLQVEDKSVDDQRMVPHWGKTLHRLVLTAKKKSLKGTNNFEFKLPND